MSDTARAPLEATPLLSAVLVSGAAGLSWEVLYQHHAALALGVSAYGTAVTLAAMMAGMSLGGWLARRWITDQLDALKARGTYSYWLRVL